MIKARDIHAFAVLKCFVIECQETCRCEGELRLTTPEDFDFRTQTYVKSEIDLFVEVDTLPEGWTRVPRSFKEGDAVYCPKHSHMATGLPATKAGAPNIKPKEPKQPYTAKVFFIDDRGNKIEIAYVKTGSLVEAASVLDGWKRCRNLRIEIESPKSQAQIYGEALHEHLLSKLSRTTGSPAAERNIHKELDEALEDYAYPTSFTEDLDKIGLPYGPPPAVKLGKITKKKPTKKKTKKGVKR